MVALFATALLAAAQPVAVEDLVESAEISGVALSPDERFVAYRVERADIASNRYVQTWYVVAADGRSPPRPVGDGGAALFTQAGTLASETPVWLPDSSGILYRALIDGRLSVWRADLAGKAAREVVHDAADVRSFRLGAHGTRIAYETGATRAAVRAAERRAYDRGVLVDASVDLTQPIAGGVLVGGERRMQRFGDSWFRRRLLLDDVPSTVREVALDVPARGMDASGKLAESDILRVELRTDARGSQQLRVVGPNGVDRRCTAAPCSDSRVTWARLQPGGEAVIFARKTGNAETLYRWRPGTGKIDMVVRGEGLLNGGHGEAAGCAVGSLRLVCVAASAVQPPRIVAVALADKRQHLLADPNAMLRARIPIVSKPLLWTAAGGREFSAQLLLPPDAPARPLPLVISYYHCDGFLRGGIGDELPMLPLARHGIAVLCVNRVRGGDGRDEIGDYEIALEALTYIVGKLADEGVVDRTRVGMQGLSFGNEATLWTLRHSSLLRAASLASGTIEPAYYWYNALPGRDVAATLEAIWKMGSPDTDPERWQIVSAARDAESIRAPVLMQLPESEARYQMELYSRLLRAGRPVELYAFADEPHIKNQPRHKQAAYARNLDWFRFWLQDAEDPAPDKAEQYARWRTLRDRSQ